MNFKYGWMGIVAAAVLLSAPAVALAKHGADDVIPEASKPQKPERPEKPGLHVAKGGMDDLFPQLPEPPKPEKTGLRLAKHGADDIVPELPKPQKPEVEKPGVA